MTDAQLARIRLVISDVDGVMTDGSLYYGEQGEVFKRFHVRDGLGVRLLQQAGIGIAVVSGRQSAALSRRLADLGIVHFRTSVGDKAAAVREILAETAVAAADAIFVGDDLIDVPAFAQCGCSAVVADAPGYVRDLASIVLDAKGGAGALRELADRILVAQGLGDRLRSGAVFDPADGGTRQ